MKYEGTLELVRKFFNWYLNVATLLFSRKFSLREFHKDIEEGMHDLCEISVRVMGTVTLLLFLREQFVVSLTSEYDLLYKKGQYH